MAVDQSYQYPVRYDVDYHKDLDRVTTFFRLLMLIPIWIVSDAVISQGSLTSFLRIPGLRGATGSGLLILGPLLMILFRRKYPRWWFDWNLEVARFGARIDTYLALLTDEYPSTDEEQSVHLEMDYPDVQRDLNPLLP